MKSVITLVLSLICLYGQAQTINNEEWIQYIYQLYNEESEENLTHLLEELSSITENPYNLHTVSKKELEKLPFLSDLQIENLLYYIYKYSPLLSIYELKNIEDMDMQTITYLLPFVYIGELPSSKSYPENNNGHRTIKNEFVFRWNYTLQKKDGYKTVSHEERLSKPNKYYLGTPHHLRFRYDLNYSNKVLLGICGEKDPGEPFRKEYPYGMDHYSYTISLKDLGIVEELYLGNYRLSFGHGLVINNNFSIGKSNQIFKNNSYNTGIKRHVSFDENNYNSGVAGKIRLKKFYLYIFYSNKKYDGNTKEQIIYSFKTDGLHRTYNDLLKKDAVNISLAGQHLSWNNEFLSLGVTSIYYSFGGKKLDPDLKPYNIHYLRGKNHFNSSLNYSYRQRKLHINGETAIDCSGKLANLTNIILSPKSFFNWIISFRLYDSQYNSLFGNGFSEASSIQNERGIFTGFNIHFLKRWEITGLFDHFVFPWMKHNISSPSSGNDISMLLTYNNPNIQMNLNYRFKEKEKNTKDEIQQKTIITPYTQHKIRYQLNYIFSKNFKIKSQIHYNTYNNKKTATQAWSISQSCSFITAKSKMQIDGSIAYFKANNWDTRISMYEKNILYASGFHTYYGNGFRFYLVAKWQISKPLTAYIKWGNSYYPNSNEIGSELERIRGKIKSDLQTAIKYTF
ncbi:helix-hairpin-helix domain-containing protein [Bacteroidales bacterium OttesenSCG-928-M06]|nr:helix-hairpin-helix domain-containing protein [Bacteroidales bacterium OttesenSCG-928-M06]